MCKYAPKVRIKVRVPEHYCMEPGGDQCQFLYPTMAKFRCRAFNLDCEGERFLYRDEGLKTHKCKQCLDAADT